MAPVDNFQSSIPPWLPLFEGELGFAVGRTSLAIAAITDPALALALVKALGDPEKHKTPLEVLSAKAEKAKKRKAEANAHKKNVRIGKKK